IPVDVTATINHPSKRPSRLLTALYRLSKSLIMDPIVPPSRPHFWRKSDIHVRRVSGSRRQRLTHGVAGPFVAHAPFVETERGVALPAAGQGDVAAPLLAGHRLDVPQQPLAVPLRAGALGHGEVVDVEVAAVVEVGQLLDSHNGDETVLLADREHPVARGADLGGELAGAPFGQVAVERGAHR